MSSFTALIAVTWAPSPIFRWLLIPALAPSATLSPIVRLPGVIDIRTYGLVAGIEYEPWAGKPGARGMDTFLRAFDAGILVRAAGDITAMSPPLIIEKAQIDELIGALGKVIKETKAG